MIQNLIDLEEKVKEFPSDLKPILFNENGIKDGCSIYYEEEFRYIIFCRGKTTKNLAFSNDHELIRYLNDELYYAYRIKVLWGPGHDNDFTFLDHYFKNDPRNHTVNFPFK